MDDKDVIAALEQKLDYLEKENIRLRNELNSSLELEPKSDKVKSAPPKKDDKYSFAKVWIPIGVVVATLGVGIMYVLNTVGNVDVKNIDEKRIETSSIRPISESNLYERDGNFIFPRI